MSENNALMRQDLWKLLRRSAIAGAILIGLIVAGVLWRLNRTTPYGKTLQFNGIQLFYTSSVTRSEAKKLGKYLSDNGFADGNAKSVQLNRSGDTYEFRMVIKEGVEQNQEYIAMFQQLCLKLSDTLFSNAPVDVHFCDENLETIKVVGLTREEYLTQGHLSQGIAHLEKGKLDEAITAYQTAININPNMAPPHGFLGFVYQLQGQFDEAVTAYKTAISIDPDDAAMHYHIASAYALKNETIASIESLREAITLNRSYIEAAETSSDFDNIRDHPEFQELIDTSK